MRVEWPLKLGYAVDSCQLHIDLKAIMDSSDNALLVAAAKAIGLELEFSTGWVIEKGAPVSDGVRWNPLTCLEDRYALAKKLGLTIDYSACTVSKQLPNQELVQASWGPGAFDEGRAVAHVAAEVGSSQVWQGCVAALTGCAQSQAVAAVVEAS